MQRACLDAHEHNTLIIIISSSVFKEFYLFFATMKLSAAILFVSATMATAKTLSGKNAAKVLRAARRVEEQDGEGDGEEEIDNSYIMNYDLKMVSCVAGEAVVNPEDGEYEYGAVTVRLCPSGGGCDSDKAGGCKKGYGDYVVSARTFVDAWFEDQKDNMNWGDDWFNPEEYTECRQYEPVEDEDGEQEQDADGEEEQYWIGVACTDDASDIKFALFADEECKNESEETFEEIANGWTLPYSDGGLAPTECIACTEYNDNGEAESREVCEGVVEEATDKCEEQMEFVSYYGADTSGCEHVAELSALAGVESSSAGKIIGWIILALVVVGGALYCMWWRSKKSATASPSE